MNIQPQRADVILKIAGILSGQEDRVSVSEWAVNIFNNDSLMISDPVVFHYLKLLGGVDIPSSDRDYLYTEADLKEWIVELSRQ